jgi:hypothetical protein
LGLPSVSGVVLTDVPTQGSMIHVTVRFRNTGTKGVTVTVDPIIPTLTPLSLSNPKDTFDPDDPWFPVLQGKAFNRAYGFVMAASNDPLPSGNHAIWIRRISASPGLETYTLRRQPGGYCNGILGTDDSSQVWSWTMTMFHPCFVAPAEPGPLSATFAAFLADTRTGMPVAGYAASTFTLVFNDMPELKVESVRAGPAGHEIAWSVPYTNRTYQVQWSTNMAQSFRALSGDLKSPQNRFTNTLLILPPTVFYRVVIK